MSVSVFVWLYPWVSDHSVGVGFPVSPGFNGCRLQMGEGEQKSKSSLMLQFVTTNWCNAPSMHACVYREQLLYVPFPLPFAGCPSNILKFQLKIWREMAMKTLLKHVFFFFFFQLSNVTFYLALISSDFQPLCCLTLSKDWVFKKRAFSNNLMVLSETLQKYSHPQLPCHIMRMLFFRF